MSLRHFQVKNVKIYNVVNHSSTMYVHMLVPRLGKNMSSCAEFDDMHYDCVRDHLLHSPRAAVIVNFYNHGHS